MSEVAANPTVAATEEQKVVDTPAPAAETKPTEDIKPTETTVEAAPPATDAPVVAAVEKTTDATVTDAAPAVDAPTVEPVKEESSKEEGGRKSPSFIPKGIRAFFHKGDKKAKEKKKEKKAEEKHEEASATVAEPTAVEATAEPAAAVDIAPAPATVVAPVVVGEAAAVEPVKEGEIAQPTAAEDTAAAPSSPVTEEQAVTPRARPRPSPAKIGRRLSARVSELFRPKEKAYAPVEARDKVEENPPQIEEPAKVEPLDTTTPATAEPVAPAKAEEEVKRTDTPSAPVVAAAA